MRRSAAVILLAAVAAFAPASVAAHVNRTVGPYTILVVLVEEPFYADNHAGFEFWVRRGDTPVTGLDRTITATASGHGLDVVLAMTPLGTDGFYTLDRTSGGTAFDPMGGGAWTLTLTGSIDGTPLAATFPVTFPSYPRIGSPEPGQGGAASASATGRDPGDAAPVLVLAVGAAITIVVVGVLIRRRVIHRA